MYIFQVLQEVSATVITAVMHSFRNVYHSAAICAFMSNDAFQVPRMGMRHTPPPNCGPARREYKRACLCRQRRGRRAAPWLVCFRPAALREPLFYAEISWPAHRRTYIGVVGCASRRALPCLEDLPVAWRSRWRLGSSAAHRLQMPFSFIVLRMRIRRVVV